MSDILQAILLGILQGLTEFLPISSSGHIELFKFFTGYQPQDHLLFTVVLHGGTALSTVVVFRSDILKIIRDAWIKGSWRYIGYIVLSMIPAAIVGFFFDSYLDSLFSGNITLVSICLCITGVLLWISQKIGSGEKSLKAWKAGVVGLAQAVAILPGISRSGATISTSLILGIERTQAARFSFLMVVPLILGKIGKDLLSGELGVESPGLGELSVGFISAFIAGAVACTWMIKLVVRWQLKYFSWYCLAIGIGTLLYLYFFAT